MEEEAKELWLVERETLTTETLGMRKWKENGAEADCNAREE